MVRSHANTLLSVDCQRHMQPVHICERSAGSCQDAVSSAGFILGALGGVGPDTQVSGTVPCMCVDSYTVRRSHLPIGQE